MHMPKAWLDLLRCKLCNPIYFLEETYGCQARIVNKNPLIFITVPIIITVMMVYGVTLYSDRQIYDSQLLITPAGAEYWQEIADIDKIWPFNPDMFSVYKYFNYENTALALIKRKDDSDIINLETMSFADSFNDHVLAMHVENSKTPNVTFKDLCVKWKRDCSYTNKHMQMMRVMIENDWRDDLSFPVMTLGEGNYLPVGGLIGGIDLGEEGKVLSAKIILLVYHLNPKPELEEDKISWEVQFTAHCQKMAAENETFDIVCYNSKTKRVGIDELMAVVMLRFIWSVILLFCLLTASGVRWQKDEEGNRIWKIDYWRSKMMLSNTALLTVGSGVLFAFGSILYTGFYFESVLVIMPFLVMGSFFVWLSSFYLVENNRSFGFC